ncbi:MAG: hypothetical protein PHQ26_06760 [Bacteroidales bacterium]|nr:hypothetical protein [Bacteroidales bacterium]
MKKLLSILLLSLVILTTKASTDYQEVVYFKSGSILRGTILEYTPDQRIVIETADKSVFVIPTEDIDKITKEPNIQSRLRQQNAKHMKGKIELGFQKGIGRYPIDRFKADVLIGAEVAPSIFFGVGAGFNYYHKSAFTMLPLFIDVTANLSKKQIAPYISVRAGYSFDPKQGLFGIGPLFRPSMGLIFLTSEATNINLGLGYEVQDVVEGYKNASLSAFCLNMGIGF